MIRAGSQTLHCGPACWRSSPRPRLTGRHPTLPDPVRAVGGHRSVVVYRLLHTLEDHRLIGRTPEDRHVAGLGLLAQPSRRPAATSGRSAG